MVEHSVEVLRQVLRSVPLDNRRHWRINDLARWWNDASVYNPQLDVSQNSISWEDVKQRCADLIGSNAAN